MAISAISVSDDGTDLTVTFTTSDDLSGGWIGFAFSVNYTHPDLTRYVVGNTYSQSIVVPLSDLPAVSTDHIYIDVGYSLTDPPSTWHYGTDESIAAYDYTVGAGSGILVATTRSYTFSGINTSLVKARYLTASTSSYALTGIDAVGGKNYSLNMTATTGAVTLTGISASFVKNRFIPITSASFIHTGIDSTLSLSKRISAEPSAFNISLLNTNLIVNGVLNTDPANILLSGIDSALTKNSILTCTTNPYLLTGTSASLVANISSNTYGARLRQLAGTIGTAAALLGMIGQGATAGEMLVDYSGLPTGTASEHILTDRVAEEDHHGGYGHHQRHKKKHLKGKVEKVIKSAQQVQLERIAARRALKVEKLETRKAREREQEIQLFNESALLTQQIREEIIRLGLIEASVIQSQLIRAEIDFYEQKIEELDIAYCMLLICSIDN
jgi:hypothetical protein